MFLGYWWGYQGITTSKQFSQRQLTFTGQRQMSGSKSVIVSVIPFLLTFLSGLPQNGVLTFVMT